MKVAILFSGHIRTHYNECFNNIKKCIYDPIYLNGSTIDTFISIWNTTGDRTGNLTETPINIEDIKNSLSIFGNVKVKIEQSNQQYFLQHFKDPNYNREYSGPNTYPDAVSMHYQLNKVYDLMINSSPYYDIIIRLRPDILFDSPLEYNILLKAYNLKELFMPEWHQKYYPVTQGMMDQFAIGVPEVISIYCSVYPNLEQVSNGAVKCGEGLLYSVLKDIPIRRFKIGYSLRRINSIDKIV